MKPNQQLINQIETKINELRTMTNNWIKETNKYSQSLTQLINQLSIIKEKINKK